jgi:hypothetical protein
MISEEPGEFLELRNCPCGSTISAPYDAELVAGQRRVLLEDLKTADQIDDWPTIERLLRELDGLARRRAFYRRTLPATITSLSMELAIGDPALEADGGEIPADSDIAAAFADGRRGGKGGGL